MGIKNYKIALILDSYKIDYKDFIVGVDVVDNVTNL